MSKNKNNIKIAYLSGPVNAVEVFDNQSDYLLESGHD